MKKTFCMLPLLALLGILSLGLTGCGELPHTPVPYDIKFISTGDGWINSGVEGKKATFGFNAQITPVLDENGVLIPDPDYLNPEYPEDEVPLVSVKGEFQFNDHGKSDDLNGYAFHGEFTDILWPGDPSSPFPDIPYPFLTGTTDDGLTFLVFMMDYDMMDPDNLDPDELFVIVFDPDGFDPGDPYASIVYWNMGELGAGDIQFIVPEE